MLRNRFLTDEVWRSTNLPKEVNQCSIVLHITTLPKGEGYSYSKMIFSSPFSILPIT